MTGTLVLGTLNGLIVGLLAVGLVLVYKSNRFLNLAHAQMGTLSAMLLAKFVLDWGWNWWVAFVVAVGVGVGIGAVVDRLFVRRLRARTQSSVSLLLLSLGISQLLLALTYVTRFQANATTIASHGYPLPFHAHVEIGGVVLSGSNVLTLVLVPLLVVALAAFLGLSTLGKTIRAAASNADAARLCGISTNRVSTITWAIAGGLSAISAVQVAPTQASFNAAALGPYLLLLTLGAAALGAFLSIPWALVGGLGLGLLSQFVLKQTSNGGDAEIAVFAATLLIVLARGKALGRAFSGGGPAVQDRPPLRIPAVLRGTALVRYQRRWLGLAGLLIAVAVPVLPYFHSEGNRFRLVLVLIYAVVAVALTMLLGWAGQVSLGHFALVGGGAYITARLAPHGWTLPALFLLAGAFGAVLMVVIGLPALRVRGLTLAVTTLGLAVIAPDWLFRQRWFGSVQPFGIPVDPPSLARHFGHPGSMIATYYVALGVLVAILGAGAALRSSVPGRLVIAIRDNERAGAAFGFSPATIKLAILGVSGFFAGVAGVLWADAWRSVSTTQFPPSVSLAVLAVPIIGGLGSLSGAVLGAVFLYLPAIFLSSVLVHIFGNFGAQVGFQLALAGAGLVFTMLRYPAGLAGAAQSVWERSLERRARRAVAARADVTDDLPLVVRGVELRFGGLKAIDGATIDVRRGEIVGLIGPNGAGKTTLMNVISGVLTPQAGSVLVNGNEMVDLPADFRAAEGLARSFQDATLFPGLTVLETLQVALSRTRRVGFASALLAAPWVRATERETRAGAEALAERLGLSAWANTLTADLSTGTRRICDLAAQVAAEPKVLLLDEPTAGVAQREAEAFGPLLRRIRDELDCSILIVEHDMPLLMGLCDRVYAMEAGRVIAEGTPEEIRADPAVIASYLGTDSTAITRSGTRPGEHRRRRQPLKPPTKTDALTAPRRTS